MNDNLLSADPRQWDAAIRNQLASISMASQVLLKRCASEQDASLLLSIHQASMRIALVMEHTGLAAKLEDEDELRAVFGALDLVSWCRERVETAAPLLEMMGVTLTFRCEEASMVTQADGGQLEHLLFALLSNGAKAMPKGGSLTVTLSRTSRAAVLTVGDEGEGVGEEALERLFGQTPPTPDLTPGAGAGLGLKLSRAIAEVHGGLLMVDTAPGGGTRAVVSLPLRSGRPSRLQSTPHSGSLRDRALVGLSDVLPPEAFLSNQ